LLRDQTHRYIQPLNNAQRTDTLSNRLTIRCRWLFVLLALVAATAPETLPAQDRHTWILIDTRHMTLSVLQGDKVKRTYDNISLGRAGATPDKRRHDEKTPLGRFHISRIATKTSFHRFFGIDYPSLERAERALKEGIITGQQYVQIRDAFRSRKPPPQNTPLGGYIGIHGLGAGDARIHEDFNWTNGCIALTNEQIDDLAKWIHLGMPVVIR
jgi:murein L,D-transpeptidase YafK